jgi:predicted enzyme related to lactoylglutathione lyase
MMLHDDRLQVLARVHVLEIDTALPTYQALTGSDDVHRFSFGTVQLAQVGSFLLIQGGTDETRSRVATVLAPDIDAVLETVTDHGGTVIDGPGRGPNGRRLIAAHADGSIWEYIETAPDD